MAYCVVGDVQTLFAHLTFGASTPVTTTHITDTHIPATDALIDATLRPYYTVPITAAGDLALLRSISMRFTAQTVADILFRQLAAGGEAPNVPEDGATGKWGRTARVDLDAIATGKLALVSGRTATANSGIYSQYDAVTTPSVKPLNRMNDEW